MGIKLNVGLSKKAGLENYGSVGSSCNLEIELDNAALDRPEEFHRRVREAYAACHSAVEDELANHRSNGAPKQDVRPTTPPKTEYRNSSPPERNDNRFPVSPKQLDFIGKLSKGIRGLSAQKLDDYCQQTYGKTSTQLTSQEASRLIDSLKDARTRKEGLA